MANSARSKPSKCSRFLCWSSETEDNFLTLCKGPRHKSSAATSTAWPVCAIGLLVLWQTVSTPPYVRKKVNWLFLNFFHWPKWLIGRTRFKVSAICTWKRWNDLTSRPSFGKEWSCPRTTRKLSSKSTRTCSTGQSKISSPYDRVELPGW